MPELDPLAEEWQSARGRFPGVDVSFETYRAYVDARRRSNDQLGGQFEKQGLVEGRAASEPSPVVAFSDLYLACACAGGDATASRLLASTYRTEIDAIRARFGSRAPSLEATMSLVLERVLVAKDGKTPRIAEYSGRGELRGWLRVVTLRALLNHLDIRRSSDVPFDESMMTSMLSNSSNPEVSVATLQNHAAVKRAFSAACDALSSRDRRVLRHAFFDAMSLEDVGALYGVHRATAARWIKRAQESLASSFARALREQLSLSETEYESFLRAVGDSLEVSVERYLAAAPRA